MIEHMKTIRDRLALGSRICHVNSAYSSDCANCPYWKLQVDSKRCFQILAADAFELAIYYDKFFEEKKNV